MKFQLDRTTFQSKSTNSRDAEKYDIPNGVCQCLWAAVWSLYWKARWIKVLEWHRSSRFLTVPHALHPADQNSILATAKKKKESDWEYFTSNNMQSLRKRTSNSMIIIRAGSMPSFFLNHLFQKFKLSIYYNEARQFRITFRFLSSRKRAFFSLFVTRYSSLAFAFSSISWEFSIIL